MESSNILEWTRVLGSLLLSWPVIGLIVFAMFRQSLQRLLDRWLAGEGASAEVGPIRIALGTLVREGQTAVSNLTRLQTLTAESRLLELEFTLRNFERLGVLKEEEKLEMRRQIEEFRRLVGPRTGG